VRVVERGGRCLRGVGKMRTSGAYF
jgi:hypothetical protein